LETIDSGNHSFQLPKSSGRPSKQVYDQILHKTISWLQVEAL
jgi:hypothetical protein